MIVYECNTAIVEYIEDGKYLHIKWRNYTLAADFKRIADFKFDYMILHNVNLLLSDITEQRVVAPAEQEYARDRVIQFYNSIGHYKHAIIMNPKTSAAACAFRYKRMVNDTLKLETIRMFESEKDALEWLLY